MTDIGRLRELADKAGISRSSTYDPVGPTRAEFEFTEALHLGADDLISEIETLRAQLAAAERVVEKARKANHSGQIYEATWIDELLESIAAYDQGKVTICDSAPTEGE